MKTDQNEFSDEEKTNPATIADAVRQLARDAAEGVPETLPEEVTQPIRIGVQLGEPPALPSVSAVDGLDLSDFDDEKTVIPTGDE